MKGSRVELGGQSVKEHQTPSYKKEDETIDPKLLFVLLFFNQVMSQLTFHRIKVLFLSQFTLNQLQSRLLTLKLLLFIPYSHRNDLRIRLTFRCLFFQLFTFLEALIELFVDFLCIRRHFGAVNQLKRALAFANDFSLQSFAFHLECFDFVCQKLFNLLLCLYVVLQICAFSYFSRS